MLNRSRDETGIKADRGRVFQLWKLSVFCIWQQTKSQNHWLNWVGGGSSAASHHDWLMCSSCCFSVQSLHIFVCQVNWKLFPKKKSKHEGSHNHTSLKLPLRLAQLIWRRNRRQIVKLIITLHNNCLSTCHICVCICVCFSLQWGSVTNNAVGLDNLAKLLSCLQPVWSSDFPCFLSLQTLPQ